MYTLHCTTPDHNLLTISNSKQTVTVCTVMNNDVVLDLVLMGESSTPLGQCAVSVWGRGLEGEGLEAGARQTGVP